jgi:F0F1-type ATP synthase epsilon subunit
VETFLVEIRGKDGHLGVVATHVPEFVQALKDLLEPAGYVMKVKTVAAPKESQ